jgi:hypothetical protein
MALPLSLLFGDWSIFVDANGAPLAGGSLSFYQAGTLIAQSVYADANQITTLGAVVTLNASGQPMNGINPTGVFILPTGYKLIIADVNAATIHTQDQIEDVGAAFLSTLGTFLATGQKGATSPYTVLTADNFVSIAGGTILLPAAASRTQAISVQNTSTSVTTAVTPNGGELINSVAGAYTLQAGSTAVKAPVVTLAPYPALGGWLIQSTAFVTP